MPGMPSGEPPISRPRPTKAHGNLHAAANYKSDETGFCLGDWLRRMREWDPTPAPKLTPERRAILDKIGMEWSE